MSKSVKYLIICSTLIGCLLIDRMPLIISLAGAENDVQKDYPAPETKRDVTSAQQLPNATRAAREEKALQDARRQQLAEKEAALAAKEQELKKLSAKIESQLRIYDENKKRMDESHKTQVAAQKKVQEEKIKKVVKLFKTMRGEQAGKLLDGMNEDQAFTLMSRLDTKTIAKLTPFINQPRILKWVADNLQDR